MTKEEFLNKLTSVDCLSNAASDLLQSAFDDHFGYTMEGILKDRGTPGGVTIRDERDAAFWWMNDHYNSVSAAVNAAKELAIVIHETVECLDWEAGEVIK